MVMDLTSVMFTSRMVNRFRARSQISFQHILGWCPLLEFHPPIHHSNVGAETESGASTLSSEDNHQIEVSNDFIHST